MPRTYSFVFVSIGHFVLNQTVAEMVASNLEFLLARASLNAVITEKAQKGNRKERMLPAKFASTAFSKSTRHSLKETG